MGMSANPYFVVPVHYHPSRKEKENPCLPMAGLIGSYFHLVFMYKTNSCVSTRLPVQINDYKLDVTEIILPQHPFSLNKTYKSQVQD